MSEVEVMILLLLSLRYIISTKTKTISCPTSDPPTLSISILSHLPSIHHFPFFFPNLTHARTNGQASPLHTALHNAYRPPLDP